MGNASNERKTARVFISSTFLDNEERRKVVEDAVLTAGLLPVGMERFTASSRPTVEECERRVRGCDWLIGIVAYRHGWVPPGQPEGQERSITEIEYDAAAGKPRLMFIIDGSLAIDPRDFDEGDDRWDKQAKLQRFKERVQADQMVCKFRPENLGTRVLQAILDELERQAAPSPSPPPPEDRPLGQAELDAYLAKIETLHRELRLAGFEAKVRVPIELDDLFVPLDAVIDRGTKRRQVFHSGLDAMGHDAEISLAKAFEVARRTSPDGEAGKGDRRGVVLLGDPGSGKTTHLKQVLLKVVRDGSASIGLPEGLVPVFLPLRRLRDLDSGLPGFIQQELHDPLHDVQPGFGRRLCKRGRLLFLLDGLDEVANAEDRRRVARWIEHARRAEPSNYFLVSCRFSGYTLDAQLDEHFLELHLRPMTSEQVETFVHNWYGIVERATNEDAHQATVKAKAGADNLLATLKRPEMRSARVYTMTHNPLLLTTICLVHRDRGELPDQRVVLYEEAVSVLLERWRRVTKDLPVTFPAREARKVLQPVAWWMHQQQGRTRAKTHELESPVAEGLAAIERGEVPAQEFLETIRDESGLLTGWGVDEYGFMHLGFQEYLTARAIQVGSSESSDLLAWLAERFGDSWWQEVILLLLAQEHSPMFNRFMAEVVKRPEFPQWARSELMGFCLNEAASPSGRPFVELVRGDGREASLVRRLWRTMGGGYDAGLEAQQVAALDVLEKVAPQELDALGEGLWKHPAPRVREWWDARLRRQWHERNTRLAPRGGVVLVRIGAGSFLMGSPDDEAGRWGVEGPQHRVELAEFYLARTPVTNAQYREYLAANPGSRTPEYWGDRRYNGDDQPVVGVSWDEAQAYCKWAGLRLPTEAQWEIACRAGTTTRYHSGDSEEDLARVGWYDGNSGYRLHAVGELESNAWGLLDMHGNVWEWCADNWGSYEDAEHREGDGLRTQPVGDASRVFRGGGFDVPARYARSAYRFNYGPVIRGSWLGFRPALPLP